MTEIERAIIQALLTFHIRRRDAAAELVDSEGIASAARPHNIALQATHERFIDRYQDLLDSE